MKKLPAVAFGSLIAITTTNIVHADNSVDWTNYLKPMQNGCQNPNFSENFPKDLPKAYQKSIIKITQKGKKRHDDQDNEYSKTYLLKNSIAFGQPLISIEHLIGSEWGHWRLTFQNNNFLKLRPQFKAPSYPDSSVENNNEQGYQSIDGNLTFDKKSNSIMCSYGDF